MLDMAVGIRSIFCVACFHPRKPLLVQSFDPLVRQGPQKFGVFQDNFDMLSGWIGSQGEVLPNVITGQVGSYHCCVLTLKLHSPGEFSESHHPPVHLTAGDDLDREFMPPMFTLSYPNSAFANKTFSTQVMAEVCSKRMNCFLPVHLVRFSHTESDVCKRHGWSKCFPSTLFVSSDPRGQTKMLNLRNEGLSILSTTCSMGREASIACPGERAIFVSCKCLIISLSSGLPPQSLGSRATR